VVGLHFSVTFVQGKILAGLTWRRNKPALLQQTEGIRVLPHFGDFAMSKAIRVANLPIHW